MLLILAIPASVFVPIYYREQGQDLQKYTWGGWFGTFDNPPQGDRGFITKHALFKNTTSGWRGYVNRVQWMLRNPLYGFARSAGVTYCAGDTLTISGNPSISDKYKIKGWMFAQLRDDKGKLKAFEWYSVTPYSNGKNLRIRLGWKIKTDKMQQRGWARHVVTINPLDNWG